MKLMMMMEADVEAVIIRVESKTALTFAPYE